MPAITADTLTLPRIAGPAATDTPRPVRSVTTGPRGYEGEGFPVVRAFAGVSSPRSTPSSTWIKWARSNTSPASHGAPTGTRTVASRP